MHNPFRNRISISVFVLTGILLSIIAPAQAASDRASFLYFVLETLDTAIFWLQLMPQLLNLAMVITSLYLMLDGVRRWGTNAPGAFSRTLIGLFILHTSSAGLPFLPYLALFLQIWLCARGLEERTAARIVSGSIKENISASERTARSVVEDLGARDSGARVESHKTSQHIRNS